MSEFADHEGFTNALGLYLIHPIFGTGFDSARPQRVHPLIFHFFRPRWPLVAPRRRLYTCALDRRLFTSIGAPSHLRGYGVLEGTTDAFKQVAVSISSWSVTW